MKNRKHTTYSTLTLFAASTLLVGLSSMAAADQPSPKHQKRIEARSERHEARRDRGGRDHQRRVESRGSEHRQGGDRRRGEVRRDSRRDERPQARAIESHRWRDQSVDRRNQDRSRQYRDRGRDDRRDWHNNNRNDSWRGRDHDRGGRHDGWRDRDRGGRHDGWHDGRGHRWDRHRYDSYRRLRYRHNPYHFSRPWYDSHFRSGFYWRSGRYLGWSFSIPQLIVLDRYEDYYWGNVGYQGRDFDVYLFPVYYDDHVEYVPYAYYEGELYGTGRMMGSGGSFQVIFDF
jgi:hypothetical protein